MPRIVTPGPAPCAAQSTLVAPPPTRIFGVPAVERPRAVVTRTGQTPTLQWQMADRQGRPVDLSACLGPGEGSSTGPLPSLALRLREALDRGQAGGTAEFPATVLDAATGTVRVDLPDLAGFSGPGVYLAELVLKDDAGVPLFGDVFTLYVEPSLFAGDRGRPGPPTLAELRMQLRDSSPAEARLLDTVTFDDAELALAVTRAVQYWNEALPPLDRLHTTGDFPYRYNWCEAAIATLFFLLAEYYRKNQLDYQAGGVAVNDFGKAQLYEAAGQRRWDAYKAWVQSRKVAINRDAAWGSAASPYHYISGWGSAWNY